MKKVVMLSMHPNQVEKLLTGKKIIDIRRSAPLTELPIEVYVYCSKDRGLFERHGKYWLEETKFNNIISLFNLNTLNGKIVAKFNLTKIESDNDRYSKREFKDWKTYLTGTGIKKKELLNYKLKKYPVYFWHMGEIQIFDNPIKLEEFNAYGYYWLDNTKLIPVEKAPYSWRYIYFK